MAMNNIFSEICIRVSGMCNRCLVRQYNIAMGFGGEDGLFLMAGPFFFGGGRGRCSLHGEAITDEAK